MKALVGANNVLARKRNSTGFMPRYDGRRSRYLAGVPIARPGSKRTPVDVAVEHPGSRRWFRTIHYFSTADSLLQQQV